MKQGYSYIEANIVRVRAVKFFLTNGLICMIATGELQNQSCKCCSVNV